MKLYSNEIVFRGHPDKCADQISDALLDECLRQDPTSRVGCECYATTNHIIIGGEITTKANIDYKAIARDVIKEIVSKMPYTKEYPEYKDYENESSKCNASEFIDAVIESFGDIVTMKGSILMGESGGGTATYYTACIDDRFELYVPIVALCTYEESIMAISHCTCNYIPGIAKYFDMGDLAILIAPSCNKILYI